MNFSVCFLIIFIIVSFLAPGTKPEKEENLATNYNLFSLKKKLQINSNISFGHYDDDGDPRRSDDTNDQIIQEFSLLLLRKNSRKLLEEIKDFCNITDDRSIPVSKLCCKDTKTLLSSVLAGKQWAFQMLDAQAKPPSGIFNGNIFYPGDYKECKNLINNKFKTSSSFLPKYCQAKIPIFYQQIKMKVDFTFGLCVPNSCSASDCETLFQEGLHMLPNHLGEKLNSTVHCPSKPILDTKAIFAITICSILLVFILIGTIFDVLQTNQTSKTQETSEPINSSHTEFINNENEIRDDVMIIPSERKTFSANFRKLLPCFSIMKNTEKLLNTKLSEETLPALHGVRFLSMAWIILGHNYFFSIETVGNPLTLLNISKRFTFQAILMGIYSVDSFFLLSGMLVSYGTLKLLTKKEGKINWFYFYFHRFYRLTPTYFFLFMLFLCLLKYCGNGPYWYTGFDKDCSQNWWYNLIYANNFISNAGCMGWTWYLANDMQFYLISPIILILLYKRPKLGILLTAFLIFGQILSSALVFSHKKIKSSDHPESDLYIKPYYRIGPYLIGILLGYYLHITKCKKNLNKIFVGSMWFGSFLVMSLLIYGLYNTNNGESLSKPIATLYWSLNHTVWALPVAWIIFACCTGYGGLVNRILSWKVFIPLSRLTYCAYLIHPMVMYIFYLNLLYPTIVTDSIAIYQFLGHLVLSYGVSFLVSMIIEAPLLKIESLFIHKDRH